MPGIRPSHDPSCRATSSDHRPADRPDRCAASDGSRGAPAGQDGGTGLAHLSRSRLFGGLPSDTLVRLAALGRTQRFSPGEILVEQGVRGEWLHVITVGRVQLERAQPCHESPSWVRDLEPSDILGDERLLDGRAARYTARAITEVETLRLSHLAVALVMLQSSRALGAFWPALRQRLEPADA